MRAATLLLATALCLVRPFWPAQPLWAADTPAGWIDVQAGPMFTVKAPPGTHFDRIRTGDAFAGTISGPGFEMAVEFGYHRDGMAAPAGAAKDMATAATIDGKPGTILHAALPDSDHPRFVGLYVPDVETDAFGPLSLVIRTQVARPEDEDSVEAVYRSVTFGYKN